MEDEQVTPGMAKASVVDGFFAWLVCLAGWVVCFITLGMTHTSGIFLVFFERVFGGHTFSSLLSECQEGGARKERSSPDQTPTQGKQACVVLISAKRPNLMSALVLWLKNRKTAACSRLNDVLAKYSSKLESTGTIALAISTAIGLMDVFAFLVAKSIERSVRVHT